MSIGLHISPRIIPSIASLYNDVNRIFMEYIDNSIDSAEQYLINRGEDKYAKPIEITLKLEGEHHKNGKITILDNCVGINHFIKVVQSIGNSDKKEQPWTNGQFGYGIYSFMAACNKLEITSRLKDEAPLYIPIQRKQFNAEKQSDVNFPDPKRLKYFEYESGTKIILLEFDKNSWNQININELCAEIEKHFELILSRKNLTIKLIDKEHEYICKPFDYFQYDGVDYKASIDKLNFLKRRKYPEKKELVILKPIQIFLRVTKGKVINKNPVFIAKGRRIGEIKDVRAFKSLHKSDIWGHPNVTGYIDLTDFLEPTIARTDFRNNDRSKALFAELIELEPYILEFIKDVNKQSEERHYKELEDRLNSALSKLAKIDSMRFRTEFISGTNINLQDGGSGKKIDNGEGQIDRGTGRDNNGGDSAGESEGQNMGASSNGGNIPGGEGGDFASDREMENPFEDSEFKGGEKKKSGFNIRIVDRDVPILDLNNLPLRSQLIGGTIEIFKQHHDFVKRVGESRRGEKKITQRLITYLAGEITVHYKDKFYTKSGQPDYSKNLFVGVVDFIYQFENLLADLDGRNLSDISD